MKSICNEIFKFLQEISQRELRKNPKLRAEVQSMIANIERLRSQDEKLKASEMVKYLNKEMLETK